MKNDAQGVFAFGVDRQAKRSGGVSRVASRPDALVCVATVHVWSGGRLLCNCQTRLWLCDEWELSRCLVPVRSR
jgi:hypothetical protein